MDVALPDAERNLSSLLDAATLGEDVVITRNGYPVARLVPVVVASQAESEAAILATLSPAAQRIWARRSRMKLGGETIRELIVEGRR